MDERNFDRIWIERNLKSQSGNFVVETCNTKSSLTNVIANLYLNNLNLKNKLT